MAGRPAKTSLDYFSLDIDYTDDPKFVEVVYNHGDIAELLVLDIFRHIYKNMYFVQCNKNFKIALAVKRKMKVEEVDAIIETALEVGLFSKELFEKYEILTSNRIQKQVYTILKDCNYQTKFNVDYIINEKLLEHIISKKMFLASKIETDIFHQKSNLREENGHLRGGNTDLRGGNVDFQVENALKEKKIKEREYKDEGCYNLNFKEVEDLKRILSHPNGVDEKKIDKEAGENNFLCASAVSDAEISEVFGCMLDGIASKMSAFSDDGWKQYLDKKDYS